MKIQVEVLEGWREKIDSFARRASVGGGGGISARETEGLRKEIADLSEEMRQVWLDAICEEARGTAA